MTNHKVISIAQQKYGNLIIFKEVFEMFSNIKMIVLRFFLTIILLLAMVSCTTSKLPNDWPIPSLVLPPGSSKVYIAPKRDFVTEWSVFFNNNKSKDEITKHFNTKLKPLGYKLSDKDEVQVVYIDSTDCTEVILTVDEESDNLLSRKYSLIIRISSEPRKLLKRSSEIELD